MKLSQCLRTNQQQAQENTPCTEFLMYHSSLGRQPYELAPSQCVRACVCMLKSYKIKLQEELIRSNLPGEGSCIVSCQQVMKQGCQLTGGPKHFQ